ncbi:MAG TPA: dual specificity protein phosphatase [Armatimonadota bacterium]|jgi:atypical dual specificity phosphatase
MARTDIYHYCETQPEYDPEWHWITEDIALGSYPLEPALREIRAQGVTAIVSLRWDEPDYDTALFDDFHIACVDDKVPFPYDQLTAALRFIHRNLSAGRKVYVHCFAGISRSAFVVCCYLMLRDGIPFREVVERVRAIRPIVDPHPALYTEAVLRRLEADRSRILSLEAD